MKTRIQNLFIALAWLALPALVQAQFTYTTNTDGVSVTITGYNPAAGLNLVIPAMTNGYPVTSIGTNAFAYSGLTSVTIPDSITSIGDEAFYFCFYMTNVTIGTNVTSIGADAFHYCTSLTSVTIPGSVTSIGDYAFESSGLTSVTIPTNVTSIESWAFGNCYNLTSVTIPNSVTSIGSGAFHQCGLTSVTIPNSVTSIGYWAFEFCPSLTSVTIPNSVTSIGSWAFFDCTSLTSVTIGNSVTSIGGYAFESCSSLTNITVDATNPAYSSMNGVLFDKAQATLLEFPGGLGGSYTIPNSVTSIWFVAFYNCTSLTSVTIPASVTSIGVFAFEYDYRLTSIYFTGNAPSPNNDSTVFTGYPYADPATVYYLPGTTGWGAMFDCLPTAPWFLPNPQILDHSASFGVQPGGFGFTISWATNVSVVVEAATNLANPVWLPVSTNTLIGGTNCFSDPQWMNYPDRLYRLRSP
jgi:hypothetical protein